MNLSKIFIGLSIVGVGGAVLHAWSEKAFTTNLSQVHFAPMASFYGIPYWAFGIVWFPLILAVGLLSTRMGRFSIGKEMLVLLTMGNVFTAYMWYLDIMVVRAYNPEYIFLYSVNYCLTSLVIIQNWADDVVHGFLYGTIVGVVIGLFFGPYGVVAIGIIGGIVGALRNYAMPKESVSKVYARPNRPQITK